LSSTIYDQISEYKHFTNKHYKYAGGALVAAASDIWNGAVKEQVAAENSKMPGSEPGILASAGAAEHGIQP
jgi:hypothetical protein